MGQEMEQFERPSWKREEHWLRIYDGAATVIFIIDLPASQYETVVSAIEGLPALEVITFTNFAFENPEPYDLTWSKKLRAPCKPETLHMVRSAHKTEKDLLIYLWAPNRSNIFDIEFVFWNDLTLPAHVTDDECERRFERLITIAERCRTGAKASRCILSDEYNSDPRDLLTCYRASVW